jgi:hypothetical protein
MTTPVAPVPDAEPAPADEAVEVFPPTLREVMLRPQWLGVLALCLVVAAVFAWLGQWQLASAIDTDPPPPGATEQVQPIADTVAPGEYLPEPLVGQRVAVPGWWVADDFIVVSSRFNDGEEGYWVTGQFRLSRSAGIPEVDGPVSLAVAIGWTATREDADAAASALREAVASGTLPAPAEITGRLVSDEGPAIPPPGADPLEITRMSPAVLLGLWTDAEGLSVFRPYLVASDFAGLAEVAPDELVEITSLPPAELASVNWLNIFYAIEWAVFAGFAFYLWYRLARDAWEKELEDLEDAAAEAS